jgi:uncharacterized delta-60 repeat protein
LPPDGPAAATFGSPRGFGGVTPGRTRRPTNIRFVLSLGATLVALAAIAAGATAAEPTEATTFGADGIAAQTLGIHFAETAFTSVAARSGGGVVAQHGSEYESFLADGAPDPAPPPPPLAAPGTVFPASGGRSLVIADGKLTRLEPDGTADPSFGDAGTVKVVASTQAVAELGSGKIALVSVQGEGARDFMDYIQVSTLNADGSPDGGEPFSRSVAPIYFAKQIREIIPTGDGGALVVGATFMLEVRSDGTVDPGFGEGGLLLAGGTLAGAHLLPDGSIEAVGMAYLESEKKSLPAILRFSAEGKPESSFGDAGIRTFDLPGRWEAEVALWGTDGSVMLGGRAVVVGPCHLEDCEEAPVVAAFDPAGNLEAGFGEGGVLRLSALAGPPQGYSSSGIIALTRRPDGSIVAVGDAPPNRTVAFLAAFSPGGVLLPSFGEGGIVRVREPVPATQRVAGFAPLADGKLLAAGYADVGVEEHPVLVRYAADGSLDPTFGAGAGFVSLAESGRVSGFAVRGDEALVSSYDYPRERLQMVRTTDGSPVSSFGFAGTVALPRGIGPRALAFGPDGDPLLLCGINGPGSTEPAVVLRRRPDGTADRSFGHGGRVPLRMPGGRGFRGRAIVSEGDGRILVGGFVDDHLAIAALRPDGSLDPRFGSHGWSVIQAEGSVTSMKLVRAGSHIYVAGIVGEARHRRVLLARLDADGHPDAGFGHRGSRSVGAESSGAPTAILPTAGGVIVVQERGPRPVHTFAPHGAVRSRPVGTRPIRVGDVQATLSGGRLILGWFPYSEYVQGPAYERSARAIAP